MNRINKLIDELIRYSKEAAISIHHFGESSEFTKNRFKMLNEKEIELKTKINEIVSNTSNGAV